VEYIHHERLVKILQASKPVQDTLQLSGKAIAEDMDFSRVLVGKILVDCSIMLIAIICKLIHMSGFEQI
jgi:hypothetical protein